MNGLQKRGVTLREYKDYCYVISTQLLDRWTFLLRQVAGSNPIYFTDYWNHNQVEEQAIYKERINYIGLEPEPTDFDFIEACNTYTMKCNV